MTSNTIIIYTMCIDYHPLSSNESIENQMLTYLYKLNFSDWDDSTISDIAYVATGANGFKAKEYAVELLNKYIEYKKFMVNEDDTESFGNFSLDKAKAENIYQTVVKLYTNKNSSNKDFYDFIF